MPIISGGGGGSGGSQPSLPLNLGPGLFQVDAHGRVTITPDLLEFDPTACAIFIRMPAGTAAADGSPFRIFGEDGGLRVDIDAYANMVLQSDSVDPTNGGGSVILRNHGGGNVHMLIADGGDGLGNGLLAFFQANPVAQQPHPTTLSDVIAVLVAYGLVAA